MKIAQYLAAEDAEEQAAVFNEFYHCLKVRCKGRHEDQLCYIADFLDSNGREFVKELNQFAELAVESKAKAEFSNQQLNQRRYELENEIKELEERKAALDGMEPI